MRCWVPVFFGCVLFSQCRSLTPGRAEGIEANPFELLEKDASIAARPLDRIGIPMMESPELERRWGKPKALVGPKGGYGLRYEDPKRSGVHVTIFGSPKSYSVAGAVPPPYTDLQVDRQTGTVNPVEVVQSWRVARVAGQPIRYCITEGGTTAGPLQYSTETIRIKAPDGRSASYRVRMGMTSGHPLGPVEKVLETLRFR